MRPSFPHTSAISRSRRSVDRMAAAAGVLVEQKSAKRFPLDWGNPQVHGSRDWSSIGQHGSNLRDRPCSSRNRLLARPAGPDAHRVSFDRGLSAEGTCVAGVLGDFHLLDLFSQRGTISGVETISDILDGGNLTVLWRCCW